ncbi:DUF881 domain-containing protein [Streptomyces sp. NPDC005438]|uniref:DUF881 domain-containing protein n=1 Tax=Streptomyces sp. NPDC005438 TaxID=3156880 RepID=UPI0033AC0A5E
MWVMPQQPPARSTDSRPPRPDASMSLLNNVMDHSLDDGYAEAAARRGVTGRSHLPTTLRSRIGLAVGLVLAALVVTVGAAQARIAGPSDAKERQKLIDRIDNGSTDADDLEKDIDRLRSTVSRKQQEALRKQGKQGQLAGLLAGATPVRGPGVKLVVDDAKNAGGSGGDGPRDSDGFSDTGRVRDRDLQRVVNGLWESGAEAVSVNGQRLTALSAIRAAGSAILVDNRPLVPPYTLLAVGDGPRLRSEFQSSADGQYLQVLHENYGVRTSIAAQETVRLPAAPSLSVRTAQPARKGKGSSS